MAGDEGQVQGGAGAAGIDSCSASAGEVFESEAAAIRALVEQGVSKCAGRSSSLICGCAR